MAFGDLIAKDGPDDAVDVEDGEGGPHFFAAFDRRPADIEQAGDIERLVKAVILRNLAVAAHFRAGGGLVKDVREIDAFRLPMFDGFLRLEDVGAADHLVDGAETELRHQFADFASDEFHEVDGVLGIAGKVFAEARVLRGDADRAGVQMADAHHDATERDEGSGAKPELLGAEQRGDDDVASGFQLAVGFDGDAAAQVVEDQGLVGLGEAQFPWKTGVFDRGLGRSARAAVEPADQDLVGVSFRHAGGNGAYADFGDQLDADARRRGFAFLRSWISSARSSIE